MLWNQREEPGFGRKTVSLVAIVLRLERASLLDADI